MICKHDIYPWTGTMGKRREDGWCCICNARFMRRLTPRQMAARDNHSDKNRERFMPKYDGTVGNGVRVDNETGEPDAS